MAVYIAILLLGFFIAESKKLRYNEKQALAGLFMPESAPENEEKCGRPQDGG